MIIYLSLFLFVFSRCNLLEDTEEDLEYPCLNNGQREKLGEKYMHSLDVCYLCMCHGKSNSHCNHVKSCSHLDCPQNHTYEDKCCNKLNCSRN